MKKPTNPIRTPISKKARVQTTDTGRDFIDLDSYRYDADLENLSIKDYNRVFRGGSWNYAPGYLRSARRDYSSPANRNRRIGFRLVFQERKK